MDKQMRKLIIIVLVVIAVIGAGYLGYQSYIKSKRGTLVIESVPNDMALTLGGKRITANGTITVTPGKYTLEGKRSGFTSSKRDITIKAKETQKLFMYLVANGPEGEQWLKDHPNEALKLETIGGQEHKAVVEKAIEENDFIRRLPFIGPGFLFRIDYGGAEADNKFPEQPTIYIQAADSEGHDAALTWMRSHGYDPDKMNIVLQTKDLRADGDTGGNAN